MLPDSLSFMDWFASPVSERLVAAPRLYMGNRLQQAVVGPCLADMVRHKHDADWWAKIRAQQ